MRTKSIATVLLFMILCAYIVLRVEWCSGPLRPLVSVCHPRHPKSVFYLCPLPSLRVPPSLHPPVSVCYSRPTVSVCHSCPPVSVCHSCTPVSVCHSCPPVSVCHYCPPGFVCHSCPPVSVCGSPEPFKCSLVSQYLTPHCVASQAQRGAGTKPQLAERATRPWVIA